MKNYFGSNIKYLRDQKGWSQDRTAEEVRKNIDSKNNTEKVNRSTISRWEANIIQPTLGNAVAVADTFNISLLELVNRDLKIKDSKPNENINRELLKRLLIEKKLLQPNEDLTDEKFDTLMELANIVLKK